MMNKTLLSVFYFAASASAVKIEAQTQDIIDDMMGFFGGIGDFVIDNGESAIDWTEQAMVDATLWSFDAYWDAEDWVEGAWDQTEETWDNSVDWLDDNVWCDPFDDDEAC